MTASDTVVPFQRHSRTNGGKVLKNFGLFRSREAEEVKRLIKSLDVGVAGGIDQRYPSTALKVLVVVVGRKTWGLTACSLAGPYTADWLGT